MSFKFMCPTILESGIGAINSLTGYLNMLKSQSILIVTDKGIEANGLLNDITKQIDDNNLKYVIFNGVLPDAPDYTVDEAVKLGKENNVNTIISVGGGSSIDTAKAISISLSMEEGFRYCFGKRNAITKPLMPHIAIPTTAGTGSEVSAISVITNTELNAKFGIMSYFLFPTVALVDANMMKSLPSHITAATGVDALTHLMEACTTVVESPLADAIAYEGIKNIIENLPKVVQDGNDLEARQIIATSASMGALAFTIGSFHIPHAFSHAVGAKWHVPHGIGCAWGLVNGMEYIAELIPEKIRKFAELFGVEDFQNKDIITLKADLKAAMLSFYEAIGINKLSKFKSVNENEIDAVADACMNEMETSFKFFTKKMPTREFFIESIKKSL